MSRDEEAEFLKPFLEIASTGELCVAGRIEQALEELVGRGVHHPSVYRMLHGDGCRDIVPHPAHHEAKEKTQEVFKRISRSS
ncbi:MAG: winged helix-turn-helix domain-containing protein [Deltaproteobacteria bacterium]